MARVCQSKMNIYIDKITRLSNKIDMLVQSTIWLDAVTMCSHDQT